VPFKWVVVAVDVNKAQEEGTGGYEPFAVVRPDNWEDDVILCKKMVEFDEDPETSKATEVQGALGKDW
jgi:hypothetical protein